MILIPSLIDETLDREKIINWLLRPNDKRTFGTVCLAPSFANIKQFQRIGAIVATTETIYDCIEKLKEVNFPIQWSLQTATMALIYLIIHVVF